MFEIEKIQEALLGLVGIRQPLDATITLYEELLASSSGLYLDEIPHFKLQYWIESQDYINADTSELSQRMTEIYKDSVSSVIHQIFKTPSYIDRNKLFVNAFSRKEVETIVADTFYGYQIELSYKKNIAFKITNALIEMQGVGSIVLELYHSSSDVALKSATVNKLLADGDVKTIDLNWVISASDVPYKGYFYIGYRNVNDELKPWKRDFNTAGRMTTISEVCFRNIRNPEPDFTDLEKIDFVSEHNGFNFDITVYEDYTDLIKQNAFLFAKCIQLQWAISIMTSYVSSLRVNAETRRAQELMNTLIQINGQKGYGLQRIVGLSELVTSELLSIQTEIDKVKDGYFGADNQIYVVTRS